MTDFIKNYWLEVIFGFVLARCASLWQSLRKHKAETESLKSAIRALLRDRIIVIYNRYSERRYFPIHERENLSHLTGEYYSLGGNGIVKDLEKRLLALPVEKASVREKKESEGKGE